MLRFIANSLSVVFHPLLMLTYLLLLLMWVNPYLFGETAFTLDNLLLINIIISTVFLPAFGVFLMKMLDLVSTWTLEDKQERIGPYILTGIFYLWIFVNLRQNPDVPTAYKSFILGATIGLFMGFFINIFSKISLHTIGMGGLVAAVGIMLGLYNTHINMHLLLMAAILIAGMVGTSRMILKAHEPMDVWGGYSVGFFTQLIALRFIM